MSARRARPRRGAIRSRVRLRFEPTGATAPCEGGARARRHDDLRRRELERHRDRLDLRRPRHLQEVQGARRSTGDVPLVAVDPRAFTPDELNGGLAARLPRAGARGPRGRGAAAADAAEGGARRRRPPRDPAARGPEALPRARGADARGPALRPRARARRRWTTSSCACRSRSCARSAARCAPRDFKVTAVLVDDLLIDVEPGDTTGRALRDRLRPRHDHRRRDAARPRDRPAARRAVACSTAAALRRRRDLARSRRRCSTPTRSALLRARAHETLDELAAEVCEEAGVAPGRGLRDRRLPAT